jgi:hypothetical protein
MLGERSALRAMANLFQGNIQGLGHYRGPFSISLQQVKRHALSCLWSDTRQYPQSVH